MNRSRFASPLERDLHDSISSTASLGASPPSIRSPTGCVNDSCAIGGLGGSFRGSPRASSGVTRTLTPPEAPAIASTGLQGGSG